MRLATVGVLGLVLAAFALYVFETEPLPMINTART